MIHYLTTNGIGNAWVAAELRVMQQEGVPFVLHSLRGPHQNFFGAASARELNAQTRLLYPLPRWQFLVSLLLAPLFFGPRFFTGLANALISPREHRRARLASIAHFVVACHWARRLRGQSVDLIHAQWIHSAGTVAMYGAWLLGVPFSFTGHAADLFRDRAALADKVRRAEFIVCISEFHSRFYKALGARDEQLHTVYCGIDPEQFPYHDRSKRPRRFTITSIGRLVEKKGFDVLIDACRILADRGVDFECLIVGDGPLANPLIRQVHRLGLQKQVLVSGQAIMQEDLRRLLNYSDVYAQPCVWSKDNDVDGTPRTLLEAMACGVPSVATRLAGIPDMIESERSGLLVKPNDARGLADALLRLIADRELALRLSHGGRRQIENRFDLAHCLSPLVELFQRHLTERQVADVTHEATPTLVAHAG